MLSEVGKAYQALSWLGKSNKFRLKIVTKVNGKDVLWSVYTLGFFRVKPISSNHNNDLQS